MRKYVLTLAQILICIGAAVAGESDGVKVLFLGNSITRHEPCPSIGWTNDWGMAASAPEKDYVHIVVRELEKRFNRPVELKTASSWAFERDYRNWDFSQTRELAKFDPDVLIVALGENVEALKTSEDRLAWRAAFRKLVGCFYDGRPTKPLGVIRGVFWRNEPMDAEMAHVASDCAIPFVRTDFSDQPGMEARDRGFSHAGVAAHPDDKGMAETAARIIEGLFPSKTEFTVAVDGRPREVKAMTVSAMEYNRYPDNYQRPIDQTERSSFVKLEANGKTEWRVKSDRAFAKAVVRPLSAKVVPTVKNGEIRFTLPKSGYYTLELDDFHRTLEIFVDPVNDFADYRRKANVVYGPGLHLARLVKLKSHDRVYIDRDAVVYGGFRIENAEDVEIRGYGVINGVVGRRMFDFESTVANQPSCQPIRIYDSKRVRVEGPTVIDACEWCVSAFGCEDLEFSHLKVTGAWRYNTDGIDVCSSRKAVIRDSFIHSFDDTIVIKGMPGPRSARPVEDILVERCVCWCGWGRTLENGFETWASKWRNVVFRDCDLIHNSHAALSVHLGGSCAVDDIAFRDIRIEYDGARCRDQYQHERDAPYAYAGQKPWIGAWLSFENNKMYAPGSMWKSSYVKPDEPFGSFRKVTVENVDIYVDEGVHAPWLTTYFVEGTQPGQVEFRNIRLNGKPFDYTSTMTPADWKLVDGKFVDTRRNDR